MNDDEIDHDACVNAWMDRATEGLPPEELVVAFEQAFAVLWARACRTLGSVTLTAIVDRVLYNASDEYGFLSVLKLEESGLRSGELRERAATVPEDRLREAIRFVLVEFLTVLGNLTADILSPPLHAALQTVALETTLGEPRNTAGSEDAKS